MNSSILLFDGVCNLCAASVRFVIRRDTRKHFRFAPLQSPQGRNLLRRIGLPDDSFSGMVLVEGDDYFTQSAAALRIARRLRWPWPLLYVFTVVPRFLRDPVYRLIASNRYRWFGKRETCWVPTPELEDRFVEDVSAAARSTDNDASEHRA